MEKKIFNFSDFSYQQAKYTFGLQKVSTLKAQKTWWEEGEKQTINEVEHTILAMIQQNLLDTHNTWNEQELLVQFIAPLLNLVQFNAVAKGFTCFSERWVKTKIKEVTFQGKADWMVASGQHEPIQPFFFLHEYKKSLEGSGDPTGQLLTTMYIAQLLNQQPVQSILFTPQPKTSEVLPIYGCCVIGQWWNFLVLKDRDYFLSPAYDAGKEQDLYAIFKLLKAQKQIILRYVEKNSIVPKPFI